MGLDVGTKTVGVAISDPLGLTAQPVTTLKVDTAADDFGFDALTELLKDYQPVKIVIGLPKHMNNDEGLRAGASRDYGDRLSALTKAEIVYQDERLTTVQAEKVLIQGGTRRKERKQYIDKLAAVLILQNYLDAHSL